MDYQLKAAVLIDEALPYLQKYKGAIVVIKYGGNAMITDTIKSAVMKDIAFLKMVGMQPVIVHGGGPEISKEMEKAKIKPIFIDGLRVTDQKTIEITKSVLKNINESLQGLFREMGIPSKDIYGCFAVKQKDEKLGFVGEVTYVQVDEIQKALDEGSVPIISPLGMKGEQAYNINADTAALKVAIALHAAKLTILTDVDGVMNDGEFVSHLTIAEARRYIKHGIINRGMIPKVQACAEAVEGGCQKAHLINGTIPHSLLFEIFTEKGIGTEIVLNGN